MNNKKEISIHDSIQYLPFTSSHIDHNIKKDHYSTSLDPRGYIPVYEYTIHNTPIMWDRETGYVHFTGIWKALGNSKSDIVKMVDSNPNLGTKKIRGGFLRIQGTWIPFEYAHVLCKRTAWSIKQELVPIFGPSFPDEVLSPDHKDYGCLLINPSHLSSQKSTQQKGSRGNIKNTNTHKKSTKKVSSKLKKESASRHTPYSKKSTKRGVKSKPAMIKEENEVASSMSVKRLLNQQQEDYFMSEDDYLSQISSSIHSPYTTPSPKFRVVQTFPPENWPNAGMLLPPIYNNSSSPTSTVVQSPWVSPLSPATPIAQDIIDTISATILLQRLSQDDGKRPFRPLESSNIPSKVIVGHQEFSICWE
ncbi:transcription regulator HTH, apses-type DNA-binding domain-containing protein [Pilobolus umbonatus]|nr:transcription regulator HTH, apses-type DNA-binding domain-containing protein [Pilobolus umbonatus]